MNVTRTQGLCYGSFLSDLQIWYLKIKEKIYWEDVKRNSEGLEFRVYNFRHIRLYLDFRRIMLYS